MGTYYVNEAVFEVPEGLVDRTVNVLEGETPAGGELGLLCVRTRLAAGSTLREVVAAHLEGERRALRAWELLGEEEAEIDGAPAIRIRARWRADGGMVFQEQAHVAAGASWLLLSANGPLEERAFVEATMERALSTLRLREEGP